MNDILCVGFCILNFFATSFLFFETLHTKTGIKITLAVWGAYIAAIFFTMTAFLGINIKNLIFFYVVPIFPVLMMFKDKTKDRLISGIAYIAIGIVCFFAAFIFRKHYGEQMPHSICVPYALFTALFSVLASLFVMFRKRVAGKIPYAMFFLQTVISILLFHFVLYICSFEIKKSELVSLFTVSTAICFNLLFYIAFDLFVKADAEKKRIDYQSDKNGREYEYYKLALENEKNVSCMRHDIGNTLEAAFALVRGGNAESGERLLSAFCKDYPKPMKYCENEIINVILTLKLKEMTEKGITGHYDIDLTISDVPLGDSELSSVLSNLIDNAIRATAEHSGEKDIFVTVSKKKDFLIIKTLNYSNDQLEDAEEICTTKEDSKNHGYGLKIIKETVKKYSGNFGIGSDGGKVSVVATFKYQ